MMAKRLNSKLPRAPRACRLRTYSPSNFTSQNYKTGVPVYWGARSAFSTFVRTILVPSGLASQNGTVPLAIHRTLEPLHLAPSHRTMKVHPGTVRKSPHTRAHGP